MKNISLILNGVLLVAVGVLYYLHFSKPTASADASATEKKDSAAIQAPVELPEIRSVNGAIGYINYDDLKKKYKFYKDTELQYEAYVNQKQKEYEQKELAWYQSVENYKQLAPTLNEQTRASKEQELAEDQNKLLEAREQMSNDITKKLESLNKDFLKQIDNYLRELSKDKNYSYVFTYSKGGPATIVFANDSLEITNQVIEGLNKAYNSKK